MTRDSAILILNVIPEVNEEILNIYPYLFNKTQLERRALFYHTKYPEKIDFDVLVAHYEKLCSENGFSVQWHFFIRRNFVFYLIFKLIQD